MSQKSTKFNAVLSTIMLVFAVSILAMSVPVLARGGDDNTTETEHVESEDPADDSGHKGSNSGKRTDTRDGSSHEEEDESMDDSVSGKDRQKQRKAELETELREKKAAVKEKIKGKRLEACMKHESKINEVIDAAHSRGARVVERLSNVDTSVREFYAKKNLSLSNYDELTNAIDDAKASALAAVSVTDEQTFVCSDDDSTRPGGVISDAVKAQHSAVKEYRDSIRALIEAIRTNLKEDK